MSAAATHAGPSQRRARLDHAVSGIVLHRAVALQHFRSAGVVRDERFATTWRPVRHDARSLA